MSGSLDRLRLPDPRIRVVPPLPTPPLARMMRTPGTLAETMSWSLAGCPLSSSVLATSTSPTALPSARVCAPPAVPVTTTASSLTASSVSGTRKRAVLPGTLFSRNSPRVPERAAGVDPSTVMDASGIGSPLLASTIVPPIVCVWVRAGAAHVTIVRKRRPIAREPGDERICDIRPPSAEDPDGLPRDVPKQVSPIAIRECQILYTAWCTGYTTPGASPRKEADVRPRWYCVTPSHL